MLKTHPGTDLDLLLTVIKVKKKEFSMSLSASYWLCP